jgi:hypothetical protein
MSNNRRKGKRRANPHRQLDLIRELVDSDAYDLTEKVKNLIEDGWFCEEDIKHCVRTGLICKTQRDEMKNSINLKKYTILGRDLSGAPFYCAGKIMRSEAGKLFLVITAHVQGGQS